MRRFPKGMIILDAICAVNYFASGVEANALKGLANLLKKVPLAGKALASPFTGLASLILRLKTAWLVGLIICAIVTLVFLILWFKGKRDYKKWKRDAKTPKQNEQVPVVITQATPVAHKGLKRLDSF